MKMVLRNERRVDPIRESLSNSLDRIVDEVTSALRILSEDRMLVGDGRKISSATLEFMQREGYVIFEGNTYSGGSRDERFPYYIATSKSEELIRKLHAPVGD